MDAQFIQNSAFLVVNRSSRFCMQTRTDDPYHAATKAESLFACHQKSFPQSLRFVISGQSNPIYEVLNFEDGDILDAEDQLFKLSESLCEMLDVQPEESKKYFAY